MLSGGGPSLWTVGRSVGVSLVPPPLAAGQFWTKACKPLTPAHICTHTCTHVHTRRDECTGAHARSHGIRGGNGFRAPPADACQSWGPRQTAGPPPHQAETPPRLLPSKVSACVCTSAGAVPDQEQGGGGAGGGRGCSCPLPAHPTPHFPETSLGPPRPSRGPSGSLLG